MEDKEHVISNHRLVNGLAISLCSCGEWWARWTWHGETKHIPGVMVPGEVFNSFRAHELEARERAALRAMKPGDAVMVETERLDEVTVCLRVIELAERLFKRE